MIRPRGLLGVAIIVAACSSSVPAATSTASQSTARASVPASLPASGSLTASDPAATQALGLPAVVPLESLPNVIAVTGIGEPDWVSIAASSVWVAGTDDGLGRFDRTTGVRDAGTAIGGVCLAMDVAFGSLWVADCQADTLVRIDPASGKRTATIELGGKPADESSIAAGEGSVWVILRSPTRLVRIDPRTNKVVTTREPTVIPAAIRAGAGGLWLVTSEAKVLRLDPKTGATVAEISVGNGPRFTAVGGGSVWVLNQTDGTVSRVDAKSSRVVATIPVSAQPIDGGDMAFGGGFAWARVSDALVAQIDPDTNAVVRRLGNPAGSGSVTADADGVWISAHDVHAIWRVPLRPG